MVFILSLGSYISLAIFSETIVIVNYEIPPGSPGSAAYQVGLAHYGGSFSYVSSTAGATDGSAYFTSVSPAVEAGDLLEATIALSSAPSTILDAIVHRVRKYLPRVHKYK